MNNIRLELSKQGYRVFRLNVGKFKMADGRWFDTGLPNGTSDLMAIKDGKTHFIEVKVKPNTPSDEQENFIEQMKRLGCKAGVAYSVDEAVDICR
jgi:hypothetical protein